MQKNKARYKVSFEKAGVPFCSYSNDIVEATRFAKTKTVVTDHPIIISDEKRNLVLHTIW